jgi:putative AlgH/UPF0301 family transcriptional regulator
MAQRNYRGNLIAANPSNPRDALYGAVILVVEHTPTLTFGIQLNNPSKDFSVRSLGQQLGLFYEYEEPGYFGGNMKSEKVTVIHTKEWMGMTSQDLTDTIGVTNDISVITAICSGQGPEQFRACGGFWAWEPGVLDQQMDPKAKEIVHRWEAVPATVDLVFGTSGVEQWHQVLSASASHQAAMWF